MRKNFIAILLVILMVIQNTGLTMARTIIPTGEAQKVFTAQWIWDTNVVENHKDNTWMTFRKKITLDTKPTGEVFAWMAADSKYWLYINSELVVFEGSLKRGPTRTDTYVDKVDISKYLKEGENTIAVLVDYFGNRSGSTSYSTKDSGKGAFLFQSDINGKTIISDNTWKVKKHLGYIQPVNTSNPRLPEANLNYDASLAIPMEGWFLPEFDDTNWAMATQMGNPPIAPWNKLWERPIPMWKDSGIIKADEKDIAISSMNDAYTVKNIAENYYVLETRLAVTKEAFGITFGDKADGKNLNMWQINMSSTKSDNPNGIPRIRPHIKVNGTYTANVAWASDFDNIPISQAIGKYYDIKIVVDINDIKTYIKNITDTDYPQTPVSVVTDAKNRGGTIGIRKSKNLEAGKIDFIKITSLDGQKNILYEDFNDPLVKNFNGGYIENGNLNFIVDANEHYQYAVSNGGISKKYTIKLPTNLQTTAYFKVDSNEAGKVIKIKTNNSSRGTVGLSGEAQYITKAGVQEYESLLWLSGWTVILEFPPGVTPIEVGYRSTGYNTEFVGSFNSDDEWLNSIWIKSRDTLNVTMRDNFMDCPDRERAQWWGDAVSEMQMAFYSLDTNSYELIRKGISNVKEWSKSDGTITTVPISQTWYELPVQCFAGIMSFWEYYEYTGDDSMLQEVYPLVIKYLLTINSMNSSNGLVNYRAGAGIGNWLDWGSNIDKQLIYNSWYYIALKSTIKIADKLEIKTDIDELNRRKLSIENNYDRTFWNGTSYKDINNTFVDDRGNALAVFSGLASNDKYEKLREVFKTSKNASPYMEKYVLEALCIMGYESDAITRMKERYKVMIDAGTPTLWEFFTDRSDGTYNHAWSGGSLTILSMYTAGVSPIKPGYEEFQVKPQVSDLKRIDTVVPTIKGNIEVHLNVSDRIELAVKVPTDTSTVIAVPKLVNKKTVIKVSGKTIWANQYRNDVVDGIEYVKEDEKYVYFKSISGEWSFVSSEEKIPSIQLTPTMVSVNDISYECVLILSSYKDDKIVDIKVVGIDGTTTQMTKTIDESGLVTTNANKIKCFLYSNLGNIKPLCYNATQSI